MSCPDALRVLAALLLAAATPAMASEPTPRKLVTVGPAITDTVLALGLASERRGTWA